MSDSKPDYEFKLPDLYKLPLRPAKPLKGRGHARVEVDTLTQRGERKVRRVPPAHRNILMERRRGGYFTRIIVVSPEAWEAMLADPDIE